MFFQINKEDERKELFFFSFDGNGDDGSLQNKERKNNMKNIEVTKKRWRMKGTRGMYIGQKEMGH